MIGRDLNRHKCGHRSSYPRREPPAKVQQEPESSPNIVSVTRSSCITPAGETESNPRTLADLALVSGSSKTDLVELLRRYSNRPDLDYLLKRAERGRHRAEAGEASRPQRHKISKRLSAEAIAQLIADYEAGAESTELTKRYGLGKGTVLSLLRGSGTTIRHQGLTDAETTRAVALYASGLSVVAVADRVGRPMSTVYLALKRAGVRMRPSKGGRR